jgi:hypothetical protein
MVRSWLTYPGRQHPGFLFRRPGQKPSLVVASEYSHSTLDAARGPQAARRANAGRIRGASAAPQQPADCADVIIRMRCPLAGPPHMRSYWPVPPKDGCLPNFPHDTVQRHVPIDHGILAVPRPSGLGAANSIRRTVGPPASRTIVARP